MEAGAKETHEGGRKASERKMSGKVITLKIKITRSVQGGLEDLRTLVAKLRGEDTPVPLHEVIRYAFTTYHALVSEKTAGKTVILRDEDGTEREVLLVWD